MVREYLIYCTYCQEYTALGAYLQKEGRFEGEYSLLHNQRTHSAEVLCRFLLRHLGHHLKVYPSRTDEYSDVLATADRFMESDIDAFVEAEQERLGRRAGEAMMERGLGQLQLNVLHQLLRDEAASVSKQPSGDQAAEAQFLLGKEEGLKRAQSILQDLMERSNSFYR